jgi:quinol monooxygenase YgiN
VGELNIRGRHGATQSLLETPNTFAVVERWASLEAQYDHFRHPGFGKLMSALEGIIAGPPEVSINEVSATFSLEEALAAAGVGQ